MNKICNLDRTCKHPNDDPPATRKRGAWCSGSGCDVGCHIAYKLIWELYLDIVASGEAGRQARVADWVVICYLFLFAGSVHVVMTDTALLFSEWFHLEQDRLKDFCSDGLLSLKLVRGCSKDPSHLRV